MANLLTEKPLRFPGTSTPFVCKPLIRNPLSTGPKSVTKAATQVQNLQEQHGIQSVFYSDSLWDRLVAYADKTKTVDDTYQHTNDCHNNNHAIARPSVDEYYHALEQLCFLREYLARRTSVALTELDSVADETKVQILEVLNVTIKTRYGNEALGRTGIADKAYQYFRMAGNPNAFDPDPLGKTSFPTWLRSCPSDHKEPPNKENAGFPDFLLSRMPEKTCHVALAMTKPPWVYTSSQILEALFLRPGDLLLADGDLNRYSYLFPDTNAIHGLIRQMHGQFVFMQTRLAFFTNGDIVFVLAFVKAGNEHDLVVSLPKKWTDDTVLTALTGLTFAALDAQSWGQEHLLDNILCPVADRKNLGPHQLPQETLDLCAEYGLEVVEP